MGFRFHKAISLIPGVRLNLSKTGPSLSVGERGSTFNIGEKGTRATVGLPGSGMSYSVNKSWRNPFKDVSPQKWIYFAILAAVVVRYVIKYYHIHIMVGN